MRILVTGGAGFLGSHLSDRLLNMGHDVIVADNFYTGNKKNISHLLDNPRFELICHDVTLPLLVDVDGIFNLACPASPVQYQKNPVQTFKTSVQGAINMLELAKQTGARFIQASTSEIYGDPTISPQTEDYWGNVNPIGIRSCYDEGKRAAETLSYDYSRMHNLDVRIVRIFNTYGPRMLFDDGRVISNFIFQALNGLPLTVYGNGSQTRSFCYVDDLIEGILRVFFKDDAISPINIGNPNPISILELAKEILQLTHSKSEIVYKKLPQDDPRQREPNIDLARKVLDWSPITNRVDGLRKTIIDFQNRLSQS